MKRNKLSTLQYGRNHSVKTDGQTAILQWLWLSLRLAAKNSDYSRFLIDKENLKKLVPNYHLSEFY